MTITKRLGIGYAAMTVVCLLLLVWLGYHEFVWEPAEFAARGLPELHKDTAAEFSTVCFLAAVPGLLGFGWWWTRRVLAPLSALTRAAEQIESTNLRLHVPRSSSDNEIDTLSSVLSLMAGRLEISFRQIREFTLHASHELKTPLTVIRAELETELREGGPQLPWQRERVESLLDEIQRLANIVDSLTLLSKADVGLVTLEHKPVALGECVQEAFENAQVLAQPMQLVVTLDECAAIQCVGDRHRLRQLLLILADNAVKYNRPQGKIHLALRQHEDVAEVRISNDGGGISPETQLRLFGRFVRGENAMGKVEGCGLGLNIAQWIVQAHRGTIEVRSEAAVTTVVVRLPLSPAGR